MKRDHLMGYVPQTYDEEWRDPLTRALRWSAEEKYYAVPVQMVRDHIRHMEKVKESLAFERGNHDTPEMKAEAAQKKDAQFQQQFAALKKQIAATGGMLRIEPAQAHRMGVSVSLSGSAPLHNALRQLMAELQAEYPMAPSWFQMEVKDAPVFGGYNGPTGTHGRPGLFIGDQLGLR